MGNRPGKTCCKDNTSDPFDDESDTPFISSEGRGRIQELLLVLRALDVRHAELKGGQPQALGSQALIMRGFEGKSLSVEENKAIALLGASIDGEDDKTDGGPPSPMWPRRKAEKAKFGSFGFRRSSSRKEAPPKMIVSEPNLVSTTCSALDVDRL